MNKKLTTEELNKIKFYNSDGTLNFNALAWEAPNHNGIYGYLPTDMYYTEICEWLSSLTDRYRTKNINNITTVRKSIPESVYDVVAEYNHKTKMVSYVFRKSNDYMI